MKDKDIEYFDSSTEGIKIKGDKRKIEEWFTNLIQNAHDFVPKKVKSKSESLMVKKRPHSLLKIMEKEFLKTNKINYSKNMVK